MGVLCDITVFTAIWQDKNCYSEGKRYETGYSNLFKQVFHLYTSSNILLYVNYPATELPGHLT